MELPRSKSRPHNTATGSWSKWASNLGYGIQGWTNFIQSLKVAYSSDDLVPVIVQEDSHYRTSLSRYVVNITSSKNVEKEIKEQCQRNGIKFDSSFLDANNKTIDLDEIYRSLLSQPSTEIIAIDNVIARLDGWIAIKGINGYGRGTVCQYISYLWGCDALSSEVSFDYLFRVKLKLLAQKEFFDSVTDHSPLGYLSFLIYTSLKGGKDEVLVLADIQKCLVQFPDKIVLILDGFDIIEDLYGQDPEITAVIDRAMAFPRGVISCSPYSIPNNWADQKRLKMTYQLLGFSTENVFDYVETFFSDSSQQSYLCESLLTELRRNKELLQLAQIPVNAVAICLTWDLETAAKCIHNVPETMTAIYQRVVLWLTLRYCSMFKIRPGAERPTTHQMFCRCSEEHSSLGALAYNAMKNDVSDCYSINSALVTELISLELIRRLVAIFGVVKTGSIENTIELSPKHVFIHGSYQDYFAALYIAEKFNKAAVFSDRISEQKHRELIQEMCLTLHQSPVKYKRVFTFLGGLFSMPLYSDGADYFWLCHLNISTRTSVTIDNTKQQITDSKITIGTHTHIFQFMRQWRVINESIGTYHHYLVFTPSYTLSALSTKVHEVGNALKLWMYIAEKTVLTPHFDYTKCDKITKKLQEATELNRKQYLSSLSTARLSLPSAIPSISTILSLFSSWRHIIESVRNRVSESQVSADVKISSINALGNVGAADPVTLLVLNKALGDVDPSVQRASAEQLGSLKANTPQSLAVLNEALLSTDEKIRKKAAHTLGLIGANDVTAIDSLRLALNNDSWEVCCAAAEALGHLKSDDSSSLAILISALRDPDEDIRRMACGAIGRIRTTDKVAILAVKDAVFDSSVLVQLAAAEALVSLECYDDAILNVLYEYSNDSDTYIRCCSIEALGALKRADSTTVHLLRKALLDAEWSVRYAAAEALNHLNATNDLSHAVFTTAIKNNEWAIRFAAAEALGRSGVETNDSVALLREGLRDPIKFVRVASADALGQIATSDAPACSMLRELMKDTYWYVRRACIEALGRSKTTDYTATLSAMRNAISDENLQVCRSAAIAIKHFAINIKDNVTVKTLLDNIQMESMKDIESDTAIDLDIVFNILVALLRLQPSVFVSYIASVPERIDDINVQNALLLSLWMHNCCMEINTRSGDVFVENKTFVINAPPDSLIAFGASLKVLQDAFISYLSEESPELNRILSLLSSDILIFFESEQILSPLSSEFMNMERRLDFPFGRKRLHEADPMIGGGHGHDGVEWDT